MSGTGIEQRYRDYLTVLDERRFDELSDYVHDALTYNDAPMTGRQYRDLIEADVAAIPDLFYAIETLVVSGDEVACRIRFDCTPEREFLGGFVPDGRRLSFTEHVFYRFREGRIAHVWSLIDRDEIRRQLAA
jgi:predicted ester cyclase